MKLKGREKYFWERNFNIKSLSGIPEKMSGITGIDSSHDNEFFYFLASRVKHIDNIYLRCTEVTDEGVEYISQFKSLRELTLKDHINISSASLPYINQLTELVYLDICKNNIAVNDLFTLTQLKNLKQLIISSELEEAETNELRTKLQDHFPGCTIEVQ